MEIIGLDLHKRASQLAIKADDGTITDRRIATSRERFTAVLGARRRAARRAPIDQRIGSLRRGVTCGPISLNRKLRGQAVCFTPFSPSSMPVFWFWTRDA